jgi:hypothetical protein
MKSLFVGLLFFSHCLVAVAGAGETPEWMKLRTDPLLKTPPLQPNDATNEMDPRIIGGTQASPGAYPFFTSVSYFVALLSHDRTIVFFSLTHIAFALFYIKRLLLHLTSFVGPRSSPQTCSCRLPIVWSRSRRAQ